MSSQLMYFDSLGSSGMAWVVLLHGGGTLHRIWEPQIPVLSTSYRIFAPDFYYDDWQQFSVEQATLDFVNTLGETLSRPIHMVGLSFGAIMALHFAIKYPLWLASLTLVSPQIKIKPNETRWIRTFLGWIPRGLLENGLVRASKRLYPAMSADAEAEIRRVGKPGFIAAIRAMDGIDYTSALSDMHTPTLIITGNKDRRNVQDTAQTLAKNLPRAELQIISDAGHGVNLEQPAVFNAVLLEFLDRITDTYVTD